jgi:uncharacterized membrane protein
MIWLFALLAFVLGLFVGSFYIWVRAVTPFPQAINLFRTKEKLPDSPSDDTKFIRLVLSNGTLIDMPAKAEMDARKMVELMNDALRGKHNGDLAGTLNIAFSGAIHGQVWVQLEHIAVALLVDKAGGEL